jgi:hypothetical protein
LAVVVVFFAVLLLGALLVAARLVAVDFVPAFLVAVDFVAEDFVVDLELELLDDAVLVLRAEVVRLLGVEPVVLRLDSEMLSRGALSDADAFSVVAGGAVEGGAALVALLA